MRLVGGAAALCIFAWGAARTPNSEPGAKRLTEVDDELIEGQGFLRVEGWG